MLRCKSAFQYPSQQFSFQRRNMVQILWCWQFYRESKNIGNGMMSQIFVVTIKLLDYQISPAPLYRVKNTCAPDFTLKYNEQWSRSCDYSCLTCSGPANTHLRCQPATLVPLSIHIRICMCPSISDFECFSAVVRHHCSQSS